MPKLTKWYPYFSITYAPDRLREDVMEIERFLENSEHGDCLEIGEKYRMLGCVVDYLGPKGDGVTSDGDKVDDGGYIITSEVVSINRTRHKDPDGLDFTVFTRTGSSYDVSAEGFDSSVILDAREAAR